MNSIPEEQVLAKALEAAKDYADTIVKAPLKQLGGVLSDSIGYWRLKNQVRILLKARSYLEQSGVDAKKLLPDVFVPIIEEGSYHSDSDLADMYASLLAAHLESDEEDVHPSYCKVLSQMSPLDATLLQYLRKWVSDEQAREVGLRGPSFSVCNIARDMSISERNVFLACQNLCRLGLIQHRGFDPPDKHPIPQIFEDIMGEQKYQVSEFGIAFFDTCNRTPNKSTVDEA
ncbi:MAG: Abi-alpha family protein [Planctomycetota bacterium]|jgi:hypothetical protein